MSGNNRAEIERVVNTPAAPAPTHIGQGTAIEQSRAVAEVQAAVVVAQQRPRDTVAAQAEIAESCKQIKLAERAFFRYNRGEGTVTGPTIHLARELARCWGNIQYGIVELRRNDAEGYSEIQAWAWDLQTNTRNSNTFVNPHKRDKKTGPQLLVDMRDIYENNTNQGSRRVRQAIFAVLPSWLTETAQDLCRKTLSDGGGIPLPQRIADVVRNYQALGVAVDQLEQKIGRPTRQWSDHDVVQLGVIGRSIQNGEITRDEEFPPRRTTAADITGPPAPVPSGPLADTMRPGALRIGPPADAADGYGEEDWPEPTTPGAGGAR